jgi:hypothetical protein
MKSKMHIGGLFTLYPQSAVGSRVLLSVFLLAVPFLISCGGGGSAAVNPPPPPPAVAVTISPSSVTLPAEGSQTFTATVTGSSNVAVNWSVQDGAAFGSITGNGVYTAPNSPGLVCHVVATSQADSTKSAMATINISTISMFVLPFEVNLAVGQTQTFTASVQGTTNTAVAWTVQEGAAGGSITSAGVYTAPQSLGTFHVIATSQADSTKSATATVNVVPIAVEVSPQADTLGPAGVRSFTATVTGSDQSVSWAIQEGAAGGTITSTGIYTAPIALGIYHVVATSAADTTKSATATVTVVQSGFRPTGGMVSAPFGHTATLLPNGTVMIAGGCEPDPNDPDPSCVPFPETGISELYDPVRGTFSTSGSLGTPRWDHTATLLQNGKVLLTGGITGCCFNRVATAELYDPATGLFTPTGSMGSAREGHTATLLPNGQVLIAGGSSGFAPVLGAEVYDPATGLFTSTGSMATGRNNHTATLLQNGTVLVVGGLDTSHFPFVRLTTAEIYDPATGLFTSTGSMATGRDQQTATLLSSGTVLIAGGFNGFASVAAAEVYDPATGLFTSTGSMGSARSRHTATLLSNGTVLIAGGAGFSAELYDPATRSFMPTGSMGSPRGGHTATLLLNGQVLIAGGGLASAELYR